MLRLEKVNVKNVWELLKLKVLDDQKSFVASNDTSIVEAYTAITANGYAFPFGIYDGDVPVGFLMIGFDIDDYWDDAPEIAKGNYNLWRLMIDKAYQGKGFGKEAVKLALDFIRAFPCGEAEYCWLSYEPENDVARRLYSSFGFTETGEMDGEEVIAVMKLQREVIKEADVNGWTKLVAENRCKKDGEENNNVQYDLEDNRMIQFGMPTLIENKILEDNGALCSSLGLKFIELNMNFPEYQVDRLEHIDPLVKIAEQAGIYYTIHLDENLNIADFNRLVSNAYLETVRRSIAVAKKLLFLRDQYGDSSQPFTLNMHMNHGIYITLPDRKVQMYDRDFDTYMMSIADFRTKCEEWIDGSDVMIVIENTDGFRDYEKKAINYLLKSPKFGLTWDIGHSKSIGEKDVPFIREHQEHLIHFHIHDGSEKPPKNHLALGDGEIDLLDRLKLAGRRNARCVLETKTIEALKKSVMWLAGHQRLETE